MDQRTHNNSLRYTIVFHLVGFGFHGNDGIDRNHQNHDSHSSQHSGTQVLHQKKGNGNQRSIFTNIPQTNTATFRTEAQLMDCQGLQETRTQLHGLGDGLDV